MEAETNSPISEGSNSVEDTIKQHQNFAKKLKIEQRKFIKTSKDQKEKLQYLLSQAEHYANFLFNGEYNLTNESAQIKTARKKRANRAKDDDEIIEEMAHEFKLARITSQPSIIKNGELRIYQIDGVNWDVLKTKIRKSFMFKFDYMLRSRTAGELQRRVDSLIRILEKEFEE